MEGIISSNKLKIIAIISMVIDHLGYYFSYKLDLQTYVAFRLIGRIAMPIFLFLIIEGYFNTKNLKKYVFRLGITAVITQALLVIMNYVNLNYFSSYEISVANDLNILFGFALLIIVLYLVENFITSIFEANIKTTKDILKLICYIVLLSLTISIFVLVPIDYGYFILLLGFLYYSVRKLKMYFNEFKEQNKSMYIRNNYLLDLSFIVLFILLAFSQVDMHKFIILALPILLLYSGKLGKKSNTLKWIFYLFFPIHHVILYFIAMILYKV